MVEELHEIQKWVKGQEMENVGDGKGRNRVTKDIAASIRRVNPLKPGSCTLCNRHDERILPAVLNVCKGCLDNAQRKVGSIKVIKHDWGMTTCDMCCGRTMSKYMINIGLCLPCIKRITKKHQMGDGVTVLGSK